MEKHVKQYKMKIAILSDSPFIPTGYRNQAFQLAQFLEKQGHEIHYLANAYAGMTLDYARLFDGQECKFKIYGELQHNYFRNTMSEILKREKIDIFVILLDTFMLHGNDAWFLGVDTSPAQTIFWFPTDGGGGLPIGCEKILRKINRPVAMSKFGQKQVKDYHNMNVDYIPHGLNIDVFKKLSDEKRKELRMKYGIDDKFVIGIVARNQPRKNLDKTLKAMVELKDRIPNAVLFFHLDPDDAAQPLWKIKSLIKKFGIENRCVFSGMKAHHGLPYDKMLEIYNVMDCFLLSTSGEGFGIPIIEAMACEVPVVATNYTTTPELVMQHKAGLGVRLSGVEDVDLFKYNSKEYDTIVQTGTQTGSWEVERGNMDTVDAADKLFELYNNPKLREQMGKNGRKAIEDGYIFDKHVGPAFEKIMKEMLNI